MNKTVKRILNIVLILSLVISTMGTVNGGNMHNIVPELKTAVAASSVPYYFSKPGGGADERIESGDTVLLRSADLLIYIGSDQTAGGQALTATSNISYSSSNPEVVEVMAGSTDNRTMKLVRKSPGFAQIAAYMPDGNLITLLVKVELQVMKESWHTIALTGQQMLKLEVGATYDTVVKYLDNTGIRVDNSLLDWSEDSGVSKIVSVSDTGVITAKGAGLATVTVATQTYDSGGNPMKEDFKILVVPKGSATFDAGFAGYGPSKKVVKTTSDFQLYTNATMSQNLRWKIFKVANNGDETLLITTNNADLEYKNALLDFKISAENGMIEFANVKAGTYKIYGYAYDKLVEYDPTRDYVALDHLEFEVEVGLDLVNKTLVMNVNDEYDIVKNSNIPSEVLRRVFTFSSDASAVASVNTDGVIKANLKGTASILVHYDRLNAAGIYKENSDYFNNYLNSDVVYKIFVIDGLTLSSSYISMYTGGHHMLEAKATDRNTTVYWSSSNPSVAKVENGEVVALSAGNAIITASQTINGVVKTASCEVAVQPSITNIKLDPEEVEIGVGESLVINAIIQPSTINNASLMFISSDESIFSIEDSNRLSVTIKAVSGGKAVLTAVNSENVIVGNCLVTVKEPVTNIKLSETNLNVKLATKFYQLYATVSPTGASNKAVTWESTNTSVATIDDTGKLTLISSGSTSVICTSKDDPRVKAICNVTISKAVTSVEFDQKSVEMYVGESKRLTYQIKPDTATDTSVRFTSFNTAIADIDRSGMVTARQSGQTQIMIMSNDGSLYSICTVVVKQRATGVKMSVTNVTMNKGEYFNIEVSVTPSTATDASLSWVSQDEKIATVNSAGRVSAKDVGTTVIMVKTTTGATAFCTVTVLEGVTQLELDPDIATVDVGETLTLTPKFTPEKASNQNVTFKSSDESVATVNPVGLVKGLKGGTVLITCESEDGGYRAFCLLTVHEPVVAVKMSPESYILGLGKTYKLDATVVNDETASNTTVTWSSEDPSIASVDKFGKVTGNKLGITKITAKADDDSGADAVCVIEVVTEVTSIKFPTGSMTLMVGEQYDFKASVSPSNATYKTPTYVSTNEEIGMIDEDGVFNALKAGTTYVQAKAKDNSGKYAQCYVTVINPVPATGITLSDTELVLAPGEKKSVLTSLKPTNSTDGVTWTSNNEAIAKVDKNGLITAVDTGTCNVTVMTDSGKKATVTVIVVGLSETYLELPVYSTYSRLYVDGTNSTVRWTVQDKRVCEVKNGTITTRSVGTTKIYATVNGRQLVCEIKVVP